MLYAYSSTSWALLLNSVAGEFEESGDKYAEDRIELLSTSGVNKRRDFGARNFK